MSAVASRRCTLRGFSLYSLRLVRETPPESMAEIAGSIVRGPRDVYRLMYPLLDGLPHEEMWVVAMKPCVNACAGIEEPGAELARLRKGGGGGAGGAGGPRHHHGAGPRVTLHVRGPYPSWGRLAGVRYPRF